MGEEGEIDAELKKKKKSSCSLRTIQLKFTTALSYTEMTSPEGTMWPFIAAELQDKEVDPQCIFFVIFGSVHCSIIISTT